MVKYNKKIHSSIVFLYYVDSIQGVYLRVRRLTDVV